MRVRFPAPKDFNPRTPCGVRHSHHLLHTGVWPNFNPRTPCGVRHLTDDKHGQPVIFQSTHPLRGATTRLPKELLVYPISIHAPLAGCDPEPEHIGKPLVYFNPRTPCGVRPNSPRNKCSFRKISIHAPLAGCDAPLLLDIKYHVYFNPRTPCGVRLKCDIVFVRRGQFQSTHPLRGATTYNMVTGGFRDDFNPRTPCGVRLDCGRLLRQERHFNPRTPCGVRQGEATRALIQTNISIHAPLAGCDDADHLGR